MRVTGARGPCVHVWAGNRVRGMAAATSGLPRKAMPSLGGAWDGCRHSFTPKPPAAGASHSCGVGLGALREAEAKRSWLPGDCASLLSILQHCSQRCTAVFSLAPHPPTGADTLTPLSAPSGAPRVGRLHTSLSSVFAAASSLPALGKRWGASCSRAGNMHQLGLHASSACSCLLKNQPFKRSSGETGP